MNYWWLQVNEKKQNWEFSNVKVGAEEDFSSKTDSGKYKKYFKQVNEGDIVIGYQSDIRKIVAIMSAGRESEDVRYFKKLADLEHPIAYDVIEEQDWIDEFDYNNIHQGTLFRVTEEQYEKIMDIIIAENPDLNKDDIERGALTMSISNTAQNGDESLKYGKNTILCGDNRIIGLSRKATGNQRAAAA